MKKIICIVISVFLLGGCATVPSGTRPVVSGGASLIRLCEKNNISWNWDSVMHSVVIRQGDHSAHALVGSNVVIVDNEVVFLTAPLIRSDGTIRVPSDFARKVIDRFGEATVLPVARFESVIIDAGHGGRDPGAIGRSGVYEKDIVLDIVKRVQRALRKRDISAFLTRSRDEFITLEGRTEEASRKKADLFVSIHANSCPKRAVSGLEVYSLRPLTAEEMNDPQRKRNEYLLYQKLSMKKSSPIVKKIVSDMLAATKKSESDKLAAYVARYLSGHIKTKNLGAKKAGYSVLRNSLMPAILIEVGFLTNPKEERLLKTPAYRQKIADGIANSIANYVKGK